MKTNHAPQVETQQIGVVTLNKDKETILATPAGFLWNGHYLERINLYGVEPQSIATGYLRYSIGENTAHITSGGQYMSQSQFNALSKIKDISRKAILGIGNEDVYSTLTEAGWEVYPGDQAKQGLLKFLNSVPYA